MIDDLKTLSEEGYSKISIQDNYFGYSAFRTKEICNLILEHGIKIDWDCQTRIESMQDLDLLKLMKRAGCSAAYLGTENFDADVLKRMGKAANAENYLLLAKKAVVNLLEAGIAPYLNIQVGVIGEDDKIKQRNIDSLRELGRLAKRHCTEMEVYSHLSVVYPGTLDYLDLAKEGFEDIFEWETDGRISSFLGKNNFIHGAGGIPVGIIKSIANKQLEIDQEKIQQINGYMGRLRNIEGIRVFVPPQWVSANPSAY